MKYMRIGLTALSMILLPGLAVAQETIEAYVESLSSPVASMHLGDLDQDGALEAVVSYAEDCNEIGCLFSIIEDYGDGTFGVAANQYGQDPELIHNGTMINAAGAYWLWNGHALHPHGSLLTDYNVEVGSLEDVAKVLEVDPWRKGLSRFDIDVYELDLVDDERLERVLHLTDPKHASGRSQPFYIFDADAVLIDKDVALDMPVINARSDRKAAQYSFTYGSGFMVKMIQ